MFPSEISYHKLNNFKSILWLLGGAVQNICQFYMWEDPLFCLQSLGISEKMWQNLMLAGELNPGLRHGR